jgi:hypothetical protein
VLKAILHHSPILVKFLCALHLALSQPQLRHITRVADALLVAEGPKTLANLYRLHVEATDPSAVADCFRESPWTAADLRRPLQAFALADLVQLADLHGLDKTLLVSIDDSLQKKHKQTRHLEAVDWHYDHLESTKKKPRYQNGTVYVECHLQLPARPEAGFPGAGYTYSWRIYLRAKTVRRLNRKRAPGQRVRFQSKYRLARAILAELRQALPAGWRVYVLFDSWYASAQLIKFCRRNGWHVICALKANRRLNGKQVRHHEPALRHRRYTAVPVTAADGTSRTYQVRSLDGRLAEVPFDVCVYSSRRHYRDKHPKYFLCTDPTLAVRTVLNWYQQRWSCEVDNLYLHTALGLGDFRLQAYEAAEKWFSVVFLGLAYLQWRLIHERDEHKELGSLADVIRLHRQEHTLDLLITACQEVLRQKAIEPVLAWLLRPPPPQRRAA